MPPKTRTKIQFTAKPFKRVRYNCIPNGYEKHYEEPTGIPIPSPSQGWNCSDEAWSALSTLIEVADKLPAPIHNSKDNITDYSEPSSSCWSAAHHTRVEDAEAQIERYRMQCANPFQEASKTGSPYYTGLPIKKKDVKLCPERLPMKYNIRGLNCKLWQDLERQCGKAKANKVWENQVNKPEKKEEKIHWLKKGDLEMRYQKRQELAEKYGMKLGDIVLEKETKEVESTCPRYQEEDLSLVPSVQHDEDSVIHATLSPEEELTSDSDSNSLDSDSDVDDSDGDLQEDGFYVRKSRVLHVRSSDSKDESSQEDTHTRTLGEAVPGEGELFANDSYVGGIEDSGYKSFDAQMENELQRFQVVDRSNFGVMAF